MITDIESVSAQLEKSVRDFTDMAVVGISGGVDSAVVASICVTALGKDDVHLVSMPFDDDDLRSFNARSAELAAELGARHHVVAIGAPTRALISAIEQNFGTSPLHRLTPANTRPRVRMSVLYAISGELGYACGRRVRVMGTGHMSEDLIGYDTKGGDALCDIFILSDFVKSEVYQLAAHYRVPKSIIDAVPSAGLYPGQTDAEELGYTYDELERPTLILHGLLKRGVSISDIQPDREEFEIVEREKVAFVIDRYKLHAHKHEAPATVDLRKPGWFKTS